MSVNQQDTQPTPSPVQAQPAPINDIKPLSKNPDQPVSAQVPSQQDTQPTPSPVQAIKKQSSGVNSAIFATVVIVLVIAGLIVYAYIKSK